MGGGGGGLFGFGKSKAKLYTRETSTVGYDDVAGFSPHHSVVVMAATNRPDVLDPALTRPGRFDRQVTLDLPQRKAREGILEVHTRKVLLGKDLDLGLLAGKT